MKCHAFLKSLSFPLFVIAASIASALILFAGFAVIPMVAPKDPFTASLTPLAMLGIYGIIVLALAFRRRC